MKLYLIFLCLLIVHGLLIRIDTPMTQAFSGIAAGLAFNISWLGGRAQQTAEYWHGTGPRWMQFIYEQQDKQNVAIRAKTMKRNYNKIISLVFITGEVILAIIIIGNRNNWWVELISVLITWTLCVALIEIYFRSNFTHIDWKDL